MFNFLNASGPNVTRDCWLCLNPQLPYYIGMGANLTIGTQKGQIKNESSHDSCGWGKIPRLTLGDKRAKGLCFATWKGKQSSQYKNLCEVIIVPAVFTNFLKAPAGAWFACNLGLTPCLNLALFQNSSWNELYITAHILPQVGYYKGVEGFQHLTAGTGRTKREVPILIPALVAAGIAGSTAIGTAALIKEKVDFEALGSQVDADLRHMHENIDKLTDSLSSLAEVVLQNRRGFNILFLEKGGSA